MDSSLRLLSLLIFHFDLYICVYATYLVYDGHFWFLLHLGFLHRYLKKQVENILLLFISGEEIQRVWLRATGFLNLHASYQPVGDSSSSLARGFGTMLSCKINFMIFSHVKVIQFPADTPETQEWYFKTRQNSDCLNDFWEGLGPREA